MIATGTAALIAAGIAGGTSVTAAHMGSRAATRSARMSVDAANRAAELEAQSNREQLEFMRSEAAEERRREEVNRRADYDQWRAQRSRLGTLGGMLGLPGPEIPDYVSLDAPGPGRQGAPVNLDEARAKFDAMFPGETLTPDMVKAKEAELKAAGFTLRPNAKGTVGKIQYGNGPIIDIIQGAESGLNKKQWLPPQEGAGRSAPRTISQMAMYRRTPRVQIAAGVRAPRASSSYGA